MGSWGTGPFHNDAAGDFLDELAQYQPGERLAVLRQLFASVLRNPDAPGYEVMLPDGDSGGLGSEEVVAGATLVALALPGGADILELPADQAFPGGGIADLVAGAAVPTPPNEVAALAAQALRAVTDPGRPWSTAWADDGDRATALRMVAGTLRVLEGSAAGTQHPDDA
jgi:hypothetical protein